MQTEAESEVILAKPKAHAMHESVPSCLDLVKNDISLHTANETSGAYVWLLNDDLGFRSSVLRQAIPNLTRLVTIQLRNLHGRYHRERILSELQRDKPVVIWCRLVGQATYAGNKQDEQIAALISQIISLQTQLQGHIFLEGNVHNNVWHQPTLIAALKSDRLHTGVLRWCNLGIVHPQSNKPSSIRIKCVSDLLLPYNEYCECGNSVSMHIADKQQDLDLHNHRDKDFHVSRDIMNRQFILVTLTLLMSASMTHNTIPSELRNSFKGYGILSELSPCPLSYMCARVKQCIFDSIPSLHYEHIGPDESTKVDQAPTVAIGHEAMLADNIHNAVNESVNNRSAVTFTTTPTASYTTNYSCSDRAPVIWTPSTTKSDHPDHRNNSASVSLSGHAAPSRVQDLPVSGEQAYMTKVSHPANDKLCMSEVSHPANVQSDKSLSVYPTDSRMRQKAKRDADPAYVKKKRVIKVEPGTDDCGEDHTPLLFFDYHAFEFVEETDPDFVFETNHDSFMLRFEADCVPYRRIIGYLDRVPIVL